MIHSNRSATSAILAGLALISIDLAGCGGGSDGVPREAISGTVSLDGQPLASGVIKLLPMDKPDGIGSDAAIKDGKYEIERVRGLPPGQYRVEINSGQSSAAAPADGPPGPVAAADEPKEQIPAQYNTASTLKAEVKAGTSNSFPFDLKSK